MEGKLYFILKQLQENYHHPGSGVSDQGGDHLSNRQVFYSPQANQAGGRDLLELLYLNNREMYSCVSF